MVPVYRLRTLRAISKLMLKIPDDLPAVVAGVDQEFEPAKEDEVILGIVPLDIRKLFVAASECVRRMSVCEAKAESKLLSKEAKAQLAAASRRCLRLAEVCRELGWAELTYYIDEELKKEFSACLYLRTGWAVTTVLGNCPTPQMDTMRSVEVKDEFLEALQNGELDEGVSFRPIRGGVVMSVDRDAVKAALEQRKKTRESKKPN